MPWLELEILMVFFQGGGWQYSNPPPLIGGETSMPWFGASIRRPACRLVRWAAQGSPESPSRPNTIFRCIIFYINIIFGLKQLHGFKFQDRSIKRQRKQ